MLISLLIPCYNEEEVIQICYDRVSQSIDFDENIDFEIVFVNDGSRDNTLPLLKGLAKKDKRVVVIALSRNFGKEAAVTAGLDNVRGDAVIILDADLQDPPELISDMIKLWQKEEADVVYGQRESRLGETWLKKFTASAFYKVINTISGKVDIPINTGDFRLMNRRSLDALIELRETHRFMKGLFAWVGYKQIPFLYKREPRVAGRTKWDYLSLWNLSLEGITGFSMSPLRIATMFGIFISIFAFVLGCYILFHTLVYGSDVPGYPSLMVVVSFFSGIQLLTIGILGEYIGRIFNETKDRPLYLIDEIVSNSNEAVKS